MQCSGCMAGVFGWEGGRWWGFGEGFLGGFGERFLGVIVEGFLGVGDAVGVNSLVVQGTGILVEVARAGDLGFGDLGFGRGAAHFFVGIGGCVWLGK